MYYYSNCRKKSVTQVLTNFPVNRLGSNFVVVVSREVMAVVMEVVSSVFTAVLYLQQFCIYSSSVFTYTTKCISSQYNLLKPSSFIL